MKSRPPPQKLRQRGILKERVFGCDLGEHLHNSGHEGKLLSQWILFYIFSLIFHRVILTCWRFTLKCFTFSNREYPKKGLPSESAACTVDL